jgi:hypothetical protein
MSNANGHGGKRQGSGRKRLTAQERALRGIGKKEDIPSIEPPDGFTLTAELKGEVMPPPEIFLTAGVKGLIANNGAKIYEETWNWLKARDCHLLIPPRLLQHYSLAIANKEQADAYIRMYGLLTKHPTTGEAIQSYFIKTSHDWAREALGFWAQIMTLAEEKVRLYADAHGTNGGEERDVMWKILNEQ